MDTYEKKYNEALERAQKTTRAGGDVAMDIVQYIFPELAESEDERIRRTLVEYFGPQAQLDFIRGVPIQKIRDWLEKQKEQKPEHFELKAGKWYICHRAFCCRADHLTVKEGERFMCEKDGVVKGFVIKEPEKYFKECSAPAPMEDEQKEQKPAEWSEEDEDKIESIKGLITTGRFADTNTIRTIWKLLDSLRPQPKVELSEDVKKTLDEVSHILIGLNYKQVAKDYKQAVEKLLFLHPSWKPSEEQMEALLWCTAHLGGADRRVLAELYEHLKKLM